jgi:hypothetical protein
MRILLQSFETGLYLDLIGAWTDSPELARDFPDTLQATHFKFQRRLDHTFVVVVPELTQDAKSADPRRKTASHSLGSDNRVAKFGKATTPHFTECGRATRGKRRVSKARKDA